MGDSLGRGCGCPGLGSPGMVDLLGGKKRVLQMVDH